MLPDLKAQGAISKGDGDPNNEAEALNRGDAERKICPPYPDRVGRFSSDLSWGDILKSKKLVGYGAGLATVLTLKETPLRLEFIVDDNPKSQGTTLAGIPIVSPSELSRLDPVEYCVVIFAYTGSAIRAIQEKLASLGFGFPDGGIDCSLLHFQRYRARLKESFGIDASWDLFTAVRLLSIYGQPRNLSGFAGTWLYLELLRHLNTERHSGDVAELGVFEGGNAFASLLAGRDILAQRQLHLFDSFEGFPAISAHDPSTRQNEFTDTTLLRVKNCFATFPNVRIHPGFFDKTLPDVASQEFSFVYYDADLYEPALECCEFFHHRLKPGGMMLFHDYCSEDIVLPPGAKSPFTGVKKAVDEFFAGSNDRVLHFPETTHTLVIKS
jgi:hypothetical protein